MTIVIIFFITVIVVSIYSVVRPFTPFNETDLKRQMNKRLKKDYYGKPKNFK